MAPLPRLAALAVLVRHDRILLVRRLNEPDAGLWGFPGGHVDWGEPVLDAAVRELREETSVVARPLRCLTNLEVIERDRTNEIAFHFLLVAVLCEYVSGEPVAADDASEARWHAIDDVRAERVPCSSNIGEVLAALPPSADRIGPSGRPIDGRRGGAAGSELPAAVTGLNHVTLAVRDLNRSLRFYEDVLGMARRAVWSDGAYLEAGDLWLCLSVDPTVRAEPHPDYTHVALSVDEASFSALAERIEAAATLWRANRSEGSSLYFLDPDRHKLELHVGSLCTRLDHYRANPVPGRTIYER